ncbi:response regulator [Cytophagaceae bacterium YF14B1]|uniref:Response regulator n=1 Tax=Xanthocytophaga flava TaxID=3048013 RepID=A0AAE3QSD7_9BACT|nr:response regulator [Xanthocytophaga flavus]MDJ1484071.1 response regulator [Xanthocytophaga flavus]
MNSTEHIHILIAEDDDDDVFMLENSLREQFPHWRYTFFTNGQELLTYLSSKTTHANTFPGNNTEETSTIISLIILDINMPRKDGIQTVKEIRQLPAYAMVPVIGFSTTNSLLQVEEFIKQGGNSFMQKPDNYNDFHLLVGQLPLLISQASSADGSQS